MNTVKKEIDFPLLLGDWVALALVAVIGFWSHTQTIQIGRFFAVAVPLCLAWLITAPWFGILAAGKQHGWQEWWKIGWAVLLAIPLAAVMRGWILNNPVQITFTFVMIATSLLTLWIWRFIHMQFIQKK
jgi:hypothetical protein